MVERARNVVKRDSKKGKHPLGDNGDTPTPKRRSKGSDLLRRYPVGRIASSDIENPETIAEHQKAMNKELQKTRPRDSILLSLMKSTFGVRRMFVLSDAISVGAILHEYPALSRPAVIEQEMGLISAQSDVRIEFLKRWSKFVTAVLS